MDELWDVEYPRTLQQVPAAASAEWEVGISSLLDSSEDGFPITEGDVISCPTKPPNVLILASRYTTPATSIDSRIIFDALENTLSTSS
jgi:hypothetical protein